MLPTLSLGSWHVSTHGALVGLAVVVCGLYLFRRLLRLPYPPGVFVRGITLMLLGGAIGTLLGTVLINLLRDPSTPPEGLSVVWTMVGGGLATALCVWKHHASLGRVLDMGVPPLALAQAIGRVGCLAAGCCYGRPTDSWLGLYLPDDRGVWAVRYPTQIMSGLANLSIFFVLLAVERYGMRRISKTQTWPFNGFLALLFLILFSLKRFAMGFLRESGPPLVGPFTWMHLSALITLVVVTVLMVWNLYLLRGSHKEL